MVHLLICFRDPSSEVKAQVEDITPLRKTPGDALLLRNLSCIIMATGNSRHAWRLLSEPDPSDQRLKGVSLNLFEPYPLIWHKQGRQDFSIKTSYFLSLLPDDGRVYIAYVSNCYCSSVNNEGRCPGSHLAPWCCGMFSTEDHERRLLTSSVH